VSEIKEIEIVTLNCGRCLKHFDETAAFLHSLAAGAGAGMPRIICLQDVQERHLDALVPSNYASRLFAPMCKHPLARGEIQPVGIGIFSTEPFLSISVDAYVGQVLPVQKLEGITVDAEGNSGNHDLVKVRATESRLLAVVGIMLGGRLVKIGTTHGPWVKGGIPDDHQSTSVGNLARLIDRAAHDCDVVVLGDFNIPRGGNLYSYFIEIARLADYVPPHIDNTLDVNNHSLKGKVKVVSDYVFVSRGARIGVHSVQVHSGVSDHMAMRAMIRSV
jgi:hypothetical protein